jgi:flagellar biosynthetic protein FliR
MELYNLIHTYSEKFIPVFIRVAVIISFIPFIGSRMTPIVVRAGLAIAMTLLLLPVVNVNIENPVKAIFEAIFIGAAIGLIARIIIGAVETAAQWMDLQMGMGLAAVFNPLLGGQFGPLSIFYSMLSMGLFFILDLHHYFIEGIVRSFNVSDIQYAGIFNAVLQLNSILFPLALKIAAPVILVHMLIYISMGFLSKVFPQANIFFVSFPLLIMSGLFFAALSMPLVLTVVSRAFMNVRDAIMVFTR